MGLAWQQAPLGENPAGRFLLEQPLPARILYAEPAGRRMRVELAGAIVAHSDQVTLLHETARYHRVDIRSSQRRLTVRLGSELIADTHAPLAVFETGFAPRWYTPRRDVSYPDALPESARLAGYVSFDPAQLEVALDGERLLPAAHQEVVAKGTDRNLAA